MRQRRAGFNKDSFPDQLAKLEMRMQRLAREAIALIDDGENIDPLFTDVMTRGAMDGPQLAIEAVNRRPALKVSYTSGLARSVMVHGGCLDAGARLLAKPYRKVDLAKMIRAALAA